VKSGAAVPGSITQIYRRRPSSDTRLR
jgi:hypothetical protein